MNKVIPRYHSSLPSSHFKVDQRQRLDHDRLSAKRVQRERDARLLFTEYKHLFEPTRLFRLASYLYGERKTLIVILLHLVATLVIWQHFFLVKFRQQQDDVPAGAPYYWAKRVIPPLEFGSMHAILFQMTLIPLTMCRYTIASLSGSRLDGYFPLNRMLRMHIHMGCEFEVQSRVLKPRNCFRMPALLT